MEIINSGNITRGDSTILQEPLISSGYKPFWQAKDIFMTNEDQVLQAVNKGTEKKDTLFLLNCSILILEVIHCKPNTQKIINFYNDSDQPNLPISGDSGFKDQCLNITPP